MERHKSAMSSVMKMNDSLGMSKEENVGQGFMPLPMTRLMALLWHLLLILAPERTRWVSWAVAPSTAGWPF